MQLCSYIALLAVGLMCLACQVLANAGKCDSDEDCSSNRFRFNFNCPYCLRGDASQHKGRCVQCRNNDFDCQSPSKPWCQCLKFGEAEIGPGGFEGGVQCYCVQCRRDDECSQVRLEKCIGGKCSGPQDRLGRRGGFGFLGASAQSGGATALTAAGGAAVGGGAPEVEQQLQLQQLQVQLQQQQQQQAVQGR